MKVKRISRNHSRLDVRCDKWEMSFVRNIFSKTDSKDLEELEEEDDGSEETCSDSTDTGIFPSSLESSGHQLEADCSAISNFFGYW